MGLGWNGLSERKSKNSRWYDQLGYPMLSSAPCTLLCRLPLKFVFGWMVG